MYDLSVKFWKNEDDLIKFMLVSIIQKKTKINFHYLLKVQKISLTLDKIYFLNLKSMNHENAER
jgi:hypothetical protein